MVTVVLSLEPKIDLNHDQMMKALLSGVVMLLIGSPLFGQYNMPFMGSDSTTACSGTLYDNGGPAGIYSNSANDLFYIRTGGTSLSLGFTSMQMESCCDMVRIYDGIGTTGTLLISASGTSLPNGGVPVVAYSGTATVQFVSNGSIAGSGFSLNWSSAAGTGTPNSSFLVSSANPLFNTPVTFTNTSSAGSYVWDFGDGSGSYETHPSHNYTTSGTYTVKLIVDNCNGAPDTSAQMITVQAAPNFTVTPDSLYASVSCGAPVNTSIAISNGASGPLIFNASSTEKNAPSPVVFGEDFESSTNAFQPAPGMSGTFIPTIANTVNAPQGTKYLVTAGYTGSYNGVRANFTPTQATSFSYWINPNSGSYSGYVSLSGQGVSGANILYQGYVRYGSFRVSTGSGLYYHTVPTSAWSFIELRNIDWLNRTYDLYINGTLQGSGGYTFASNTVTEVSKIDLYNTSSNIVSYDDFQVLNTNTEPMQLTPGAGTLAINNSTVVSISKQTTGMVAGRYDYEILVRTNGIGSDSLKVIPLTVDILGNPQISLDKSCINFGSVYTTQTYEDSIRIVNAGCDTLDISSIVSTTADIALSDASMKINPFDTTYLYVTVAPSMAGIYQDTIYLNNNASDIAVCVLGTGLASPVIRSDSASYNVTSVGCNDSIRFPITVYNDGQAGLTWSVTGRLKLTDDFETGGSIWQSLGSNVIGGACFTSSGSNALSITGSDREAVTQVYQSNGTDSVSFWVMPGNGTSTVNCENPDGSEDLFFQYSIDNGSTWNSFYTIYNTWTSPVLVKLLIPVTGPVQFRFWQPNYTGSTIDNYIVDDFTVGGSNTDMTFSPASGTTATADSTVVICTIDIEDFNSGTYTIPVDITSNDPNVPVLSLGVTLTVIGEPELATGVNCINFGTVINGNVILDSVAVYNTGCSNLIISGVSATGTDFAASLSNNTIAPNDTGYVNVTYTSSFTGSLNDTLFIQSNDTVGVVCLSAVGVGAPVYDVIPDSIYVQTTVCNDSADVTINITNINGQSPLYYTMDSITPGNSAMNITVLKSYSDVGREYAYAYNALTANLPTAVFLESQATTAAAFRSDLQGADVLVIPEQEYMSNAKAIEFGPVIQDFANAGGQVLILGNSSGIISGFGVMSYTNWTTSVPTYLNISDPTHPVFDNVNTSGFARTGAVSAYQITNPGLVTLASGYNSIDNVIAVYPYGAGTIGYIGFDFYYTHTELVTSLKNMVEFLYSRHTVDWAYLTNHSDTVAVNDTAQTVIHLNSSGLSNGRYSGRIRVITNDPSNAEVFIPFVMDVNGEAEMRLETACVELDSVLVGASTISQTTMYNDGCDTLRITSAFSSTGDYAIGGTLPLLIAPGDSVVADVTFTPSAMGVRNDTMWVCAQNDTLPLCVNGKGLGAPVLTQSSDTIEVTLNKCDNFTLESYQFSNTGQGSMDFQLTFGEYYSARSLQNFTSSPNSTTHNFTNTPTSADSIRVTVITSGDFDATYEYFSMYIDGYFMGDSYGLTHPVNATDTVTFLLTTATINTILSDGVMNFSLNNSGNVTVVAGIPNYHEVTVEVFKSGLPVWLTVPSPTTGTVAVGGSNTTSLLFTGTSIPVGTYYSGMTVHTNDPVNPTQIVPIIFNLQEEAIIRLSDTCLQFNKTMLGDTTTMSLWVINDGCLPLNVTQITSLSNVFKVSPSTLTVPGGDSVMVDVSFIPTTVSNYSSSITVNSNAGSVSFCVNGSADATPVADFNFTVINECDGQVLFSDHSLQSPTSFAWEFGDGTVSTLQNPVHTYERPGTYMVRLTATNSSGWDTITQAVTVNPLYVNFSVEMMGSIVTRDTIYINEPIQYYDSSQTASTWKWYLGDGTVSAVQNPVHTYTSIGNYQITLEVEDTAGCKRSRSKSMWVLNGIGLNELNAGSIAVYPNPSHGVFTVVITEVDLRDGRMQVTDLSGAVLFEGHSLTGSGETVLDLSGLPKGVYVLRLTDQGRMVGHERLIIQ